MNRKIKRVMATLMTSAVLMSTVVGMSAAGAVKYATMTKKYSTTDTRFDFSKSALAGTYVYFDYTVDKALIPDLAVKVQCGYNTLVVKEDTCKVYSEHTGGGRVHSASVSNGTKTVTSADCSSKGWSKRADVKHDSAKPTYWGYIEFAK